MGTTPLSPAVRRHAALLTMLATELGVAALALFFHLHARVAILAAFRDYGTELPATAALALSAWFLPGALAFAALATLIAIAAPLRRTRRALLVGVGLLVASCALIFAVAAAFLPLFRPV
jgi:hypothetical protein